MAIINTVVGFDNYGYYKHKDENGELIETSVRAKIKISDDPETYEPGPDIPKDSGNTDWQNYLTWVAEGNTAEVVGE